jgi:hypothetical protein
MPGGKGLPRATFFAMPGGKGWATILWVTK